MTLQQKLDLIEAKLWNGIKLSEEEKELEKNDNQTINPN